MKMSSVGDELFCAHGRTDSLMKLIVAFNNFYKFCTYFRTRLAICPIQHKVTVINYGGGEFLLLGTTRVFKEKGFFRC